MLLLLRWILIVVFFREYKVCKEWTSAASTKRSYSFSKSRKLYRQCFTRIFSPVRSRSAPVKGNVLARVTQIQNKGTVTVLTLARTCVIHLTGLHRTQTLSVPKNVRQVDRGTPLCIWCWRANLDLNLASLLFAGAKWGMLTKLSWLKG